MPFFSKKPTPERGAWGERYGRRVEDDRLPTRQEDRHADAQVIGADGEALLSAIYALQAPAWLREGPAVKTVRRVWGQPCYMESGGGRWRTEKEAMPSSGRCISSPDDVEARYGHKQTMSWVGYTGQVTETCEDGAPHLSTPGETTAGPVSDGAATPHLHQALERQGLLPTTPLVDTGDLDAERFVTSQREDRVDLLGPLRADGQWQVQAAQGFDARQFQIAWEPQRATCPRNLCSV
jgi:transposase